MIVVSIIGILASISLPSFVVFQCKSKQSEAKVGLKAMYVTELAYNGEHGTYLNLTRLTGMGGLDSRTVSGTKYYGYTSSNLTNSTFTMVAQDTKSRIRPSTVSDSWTLTQASANIVSTVNACR